MGWYRLASHLHKTVQEVRQKTTSTEFVLWMEYLEKDTNAFHREDYYLAQIAAEIRRSFVKKPKQVKLKDFLLKFVMQEKPKKLSIKERTKRMKQFWFFHVGLKDKKV